MKKLILLLTLLLATSCYGDDYIRSDTPGKPDSYYDGVYLRLDQTAPQTVTGTPSFPSLTLPTAGWIGLGVAAGRIVFTDLAVDVATVTGCIFKIGNTLYIGDTTTDLDALIAGAQVTAGDSLVLTSGTWTVTDGIDITKSINIVGQGVGETTVTCATASKINFDIAASNVRIADMTITDTGGSGQGIRVIGNYSGIVIENCNISMSGAGDNYGINIVTAGGIIRNCIVNASSTANTSVGIYTQSVANSTSASVVNCYNTQSTISNGGPAFQVRNINNVLSATLNLYDCVGRAGAGAANDFGASVISTTTNNSIINAYNCTFNGADADVSRTGTNTLTLYGPTCLVNGTTSGTITYAGTVVTGSLFVDNVLNLGADDNPADLYIHDGGGIWMYEDSDDFLCSAVCKDGAAEWQFNDDVNIGATGAPENLYVHDGGSIYAYSAGDDKSIQISHNDTDANIAVSSGELNLSASVFDFDSNSNSQCIYIRGLDAGTEWANLFIDAGDDLNISVNNGGVNITNSNVIFVPIGGDIATYITAASADDVLQLAAGSYVLTSGLTVSKKLHFRGMGKGITTVTCATANVTMFTMSAAGNVLSDMTIQSTATNTGAAKMITHTAAFDMRNVEILNAAAGGVQNDGFSTGSSATVNIETCSYAATGASTSHIFVYNSSGGIVNVRRCNATEDNTGTSSTIGGVLFIVATANNSIINVYEGTYTSSNDCTYGIAYNARNTAQINFYNSTLNASHPNMYELFNLTTGTITVYDTTLVGGKTSGTITTSGTVVSKNLNLGGTFNYAADGQASDTYVISLTGVTAYTTGLVVYFKANTANTGACTLNVNGLGAIALKSKHDADPEDNYIEAGSIVHCIYDGSVFQMLQPDANP